MLEAVRLFRSLGAEDITEIEDHTNVKRCRRNTIVIERGDESNSLYFIISGQVRVFVAGDDGKEVTLDPGRSDFSGVTTRSEVVGIGNLETAAIGASPEPGDLEAEMVDLQDRLRACRSGADRMNR